MLAAYPAAPLVAVVCDNAIIHHSKIVQRWLASHPRLRVLHGARYSPHDNPVERIWAALKAYLANSPTLTMAGRIRQVHAFLPPAQPTQLLATAAPHSSPWLPDGYGQDPGEAALACPAQSSPARHGRRLASALVGDSGAITWRLPPVGCPPTPGLAPSAVR